jgi:RNA-binding protein
LRLLGKVLHVGSRGLIARGSSAPKVGQLVVDSSEKPVGRVLDVFGPVSSPYFVIRQVSGVSKGDWERIVGSSIYMGEEYGKAGKPEKVHRVRKHKAGA